MANLKHALLAILLIAIAMDAFSQALPEKQWVDTDDSYTDAAGNTMSVTNSLPRGGGTYQDRFGNTYSYVIFWYRVRNTSKVPMELKLSFPAGLSTLQPLPTSSVRMFLHPQAMTVEKVTLYDYGLTDLKKFWDEAWHEPSHMDRIIAPGQETLFYIPVLMQDFQGPARATLLVEDQDLSYRISIGDKGTVVPCGRITFGK